VVLRRTYTWGIERDLVTVLPFIGLKKPAPEVRSERVMTAAEIAAALSALDVLAQPRALEGERPKHASKTGPGWPAYADAARLLFLTGVRRDMVLGMRRSELEDLNGTDPRWTIPGGFGGRSKSGKAHVVPLSAPAVEIIKRRLAAVSGELLFPLRRRGKLPGGERLDSRHMTWSSHFVSELQAQTAELAGAPVPGWTIHGIRHTVATHMREDLKVGREVVSTVLGHTQAGPSATRIYDRSELLPERRAALIAWAAWLDRIREAKRGADVLPMARTS
jgi:integrase